MKLAVQTVECWEATADSYVATAEPFTSLFCADAVELAGITPGMTLLDVATGPGALALAAARAGAEVTAVDFAQSMIDRLSARIDGLRVTPRRMDGQALDLPDASFDCVCSVFGVPLFPDWRAGLCELVRVTSPGGIVVLGVADNPHGFGPNVLFANARAELLPDSPAAGIPAMHVLANRARLSGLAPPTIHARTHDFLLDPGIIAAGSRIIVDNPILADLSLADVRRVVALAAAKADRLRDGATARLPGTAWIAVATRP